MSRQDTAACLRTLRAIVRVLSGTQWSADTLDAIADILRAAGFVIKEPRS